MGLTAADPDAAARIAGTLRGLGVTPVEGPGPAWVVDTETAMALRRLPAGVRAVVAVADEGGGDFAMAAAAAIRLGVDAVVPVSPVDALGVWVSSLPRPHAHAVGVMGARGGAGASTVAVALGLAAAEDGAALLVDGDPAGGGLDLVAGAEDLPGHRWPDLDPDRLPGVDGLLRALPGIGELAVLSHARVRPGAGPAPGTPGAVPVTGGGAAGTGADVGVLLAATADAGMVVVLDLPRCAAGMDLARRCGHLVLVTPPEVGAAAAAARLLPSIMPQPVDLLVTGHSPGGLSAAEIAAAVGANRWTRLRHRPGAAADAERGVPVAASPRSALRRWARQYVHRVRDAGPAQLLSSGDPADRSSPRAARW